ncbi:MAG: endonuclease/exonuclease/phosphatase family protein [Patescibacteria group bacterium]
MRIRIIVANIQSGIGVTKGYRQYVTSGWRYLFPHDSRGAMDAGTFLKAEDADIALLTEVDAGSRRSRNASQMDSMAKGSGLPHARFFPTRIMGTSINEGNVILSRFPISADRSYPLLSRMNPRTLGETTLMLPDGTSMTALVAHLALGSKPREVQLAEIAEYVKDIDGPLVLGGDFNERDHRSFRFLKRVGLTAVSVAGYPSWKPRHALQVLFLSHHFSLVQASVPDGARFSDHLPLIVEVSYGEREF